MSESNPNHTLMPTQKTDLLNPLPDVEFVDMKTSLLNHLASTSRKIQTAIVVAGLIQTVVIIAGLVIINDALHP